MSGLRVSSLLAVFAMLALWLVPEMAHARTIDEPSFAPQCHAASGTQVTFEAMTDTRRWTCSKSGWRADRPVAWVRFDAEAWQGEELPRYFFTRIARYETISFAALDADGSMRTVEFKESDGAPFAAGPVFQLHLPEVTAETRTVVMRVEKPHSVPLLTEARLSHYPEDADWTQLEVMLLALVIGMLVLPLMFDISFFVVLRERFVAIHALMVVSMMAYVLFAGGLVSVFVQLPLQVIAVAGPLAWAIGSGLSALFMADFLEKGAQSRFMRRLTLATGIWTIMVPGFFALQLHSTQAFDDRAYFITFIPAIMIISAALLEALARGSKSARFLTAAWVPIILASTERMLRGLGVYVGPSSLDQMMYVATGLEVIVISLAIASRFLALRRERDAAVTEARMMEQLSERDPLTGLMNRRALEVRFGDLRLQGFDTFALIDLDQFKQVNDRFGHQIGDRALIACANAIRGNGDRDTIAVRLGGEEFVLLLRGKRAVERAETLRRAVPVRIASEVAGLNRPVTASMGVIELPRASDTLMGFHDLYARADRLLYEAKASGRNRMYFERLTIFAGRPELRAARDVA
jgi:diguanylate cyclase (GGDEF)-like protein